MFADNHYLLHLVHFVDRLLRKPDTKGCRLWKALQKYSQNEQASHISPYYRVGK